MELKDMHIILGLTDCIASNISDLVDLINKSSDIYHCKQLSKRISEDLLQIDKIIYQELRSEKMIEDSTMTEKEFYFNENLGG